MTTRYAKSFHKKVKPPAGERCSLKWHYTGVMRELIGFFDEMAALDETGERFVFTSIAYIIETAEKNCKRFNGKPYSESSIRHGLAEARARRVISKLLERERWLPSGQKGHEMLRALGGSIVANHDCVTHFENGECTWVGPMHGCGRWQRTGNGGPGSILYWNGCGLHAPATGGLPNGKQSLSAPDAGPSADGVQGTVQTVCIPCAEPMAQADSGQPSDLPEVNLKNGGQAVVTVMPVQTASAVQPEQPSYPVKPAPPAKPAATLEPKPGGLTTSQSVRACALTNEHDVTKPTGRGVTTGQRFAIKEDIELLQGISDGEYNVYAYKDDITTLAEYTRMVVEEIAGVPWDGQRSTCAGMMDAVAKRMTRDRKRWPEGWLAVIKELRKGGPCRTQYTPPQPAHWVGRQDHDGPPNEQDAKAHAASEWNMCRDWLCRNAANREADGYTVKAADGVWDKA